VTNINEVSEVAKSPPVTELPVLVDTEKDSEQVNDKEITDDYQTLKDRIISKFINQIPLQWNEVVDGVKTKLSTGEKVIALTFDACGGSRGSGYDRDLINYLIDNQVPVTLFINARWIDANFEIFGQLADNPLFEIANHGTEHKPCSVNSKSIYGEAGTNNVGEVVDEIEKNARKIEAIIGHRPKYYRSGTAYYDEVCVRVSEDLGHEVAGFNVLGDAGATFLKEQVKKALLSVSPGSIVLLHMNQPNGDTAEGVIAAIPMLKEMGYSFVLLSEHVLE